MLLPVAILAGGLATRLRPLTEQIPKALIDVNGEPFVTDQLGQLRLPQAPPGLIFQAAKKHNPGCQPALRDRRQVAGYRSRDRRGVSDK